MAAAEPKPSLVERLFAEHRAALQTFFLRRIRTKSDAALRNLQISGVFATDDTEAFIAFLRSLKGVRVEVTETQIRVW